MEAGINPLSDGSPIDSQRVDEVSSIPRRQEEQVETSVKKLEKREVERAAERLNDALKTFNRDLAISVREDGKLVVRVTERSTGDLIRQIPPEQVLKVEESLDKIVGLFVNDMA